MEPKMEQEPAFNIEPPQLGDEEGIGPMHIKAWKESYLNPELGVTEEWIDEVIGHFAVDFTHRRNTIVEALANPDQVLYRVVKNANGEIVGFLHGTKGEEFNELEGIYILNEAKKTGTGGRLMAEFLDWADKEKPCHLGVFSFNEDALGFYKRYGFEKTDKPEGLHKEKMPFIEMVRPAEESYT
jgi:GNAT superfamily N-acetyltransferase